VFEDFTQSYVAETCMRTVPFDIGNLSLDLHTEEGSKCLSDAS
jgi:hypothetical protein